MKKNIYNVINIVFLSMMLVSCDSCDDDPIASLPAVPDNIVSDSAGDFTIVNTRTNDTITVKVKSEDEHREITAHIGDTLKITFNPEENYKDFSFKKNYDLPNNQKGVGDEYKYIITNLKKGVYNIDLHASSLGTTDDTNWNLTANGSFNLIIVPHVNIDYELQCPHVLLEYATPQVTYVGNDGKPVTFTISEYDWEDISEDDWEEETTIIVIDGDTVVSERTKIMQWTKHVEYDNFSSVDDEMTVVYIPKDNIPTGNVNRVQNLAPHLYADLEFVDDDGKKHKPKIIDVGISINIGSKGTPLLDIINNIRDCIRYHVESNGTYERKRE